VVNFIFLRARIREDWQQFIQSVDASEIPTGGPVTAEEFRRIALVVALAISNPREWWIQFFFSMILICSFPHRKNRVGCYPFC
jgi:hypothetical protein